MILPKWSLSVARLCCSEEKRRQKKPESSYTTVVRFYLPGCLTNGLFFCADTLALQPELMDKDLHAIQAVA